jgi:hypothetical protein
MNIGQNSLKTLPVRVYQDKMICESMVRLKGGDTFNINLCDTDDKCGDVMTVRK